MSEKRRDNKDRILRSGESQRKDGRYMYTHLDFHDIQKEMKEVCSRWGVK